MIKKANLKEQVNSISELFTYLEMAGTLTKENTGGAYNCNRQLRMFKVGAVDRN